MSATNEASLPSDLKAMLQSDALYHAWQQCLETVNGSISHTDENRLFAVGLRNRFLEVLDDVTDSQEQQYLLYVFYCLVRCQWVLCNVQSGYQLVAGRMERMLYAQSGMLSALSGHIESCLDPATVKRVSAMLSQSPSLNVPHEPDSLSPAASAEAFHFKQLETERKELQAEVQAHQAEREQLRQAFGTADPSALVAYVSGLQAQLAALSELQALLGGIEETTTYLH